MQNIIKNVPIGFEVSARKRLEGIVNVSLYSQDIKTGRFAFMLVNSEGESVSLDSTYSAKALVKFQKSKSIFLDDLIIEQDIIKFEFPSNLIQTDEKVTMYIYITKESYTSDVIAITFNVYLSEVDKIGDVVASVYDGRYESVVSEFEIRVQEYKSSANVLVSEFEQALEDYKLTLPQADSMRAEIDVVLNQFGVDGQAKLNQYDADAQQVIADNQTAFSVAESGRQADYEQAEDSRNQASEQAVVDWEQGADALLETVESNESARVDAEATRKTAETDRVSSEATRKSNETTRVTNENERESAEVIRLANEADRINAESVRSEFYEGFESELGKKANKIQEDWITPTLLNGFTGDVKYRKTEFNQLEIRGAVSYPTALNSSTQAVFEVMSSFVPKWFDSWYDARRFKFNIVKDYPEIENATARASLSSYNNYFYITNGGGGTKWHVNITIPIT